MAIAGSVQRVVAMAWVAAALAMGPSSCQHVAPASLQVKAQQTGAVNLTIHVPKKHSKPVRQVLTTVDESSTLLVNRVEVSLSGPGFYTPLYPTGTETDKGRIDDISSGSIATVIKNVPTGDNRFIKVVAKNGDQKLNQVGGVLTVISSTYNHAVIGLSTTPTAEIIEKLSLRYPEVAPLLSAQALQAFLDGSVTRPVTDVPARQNTFAGVHPYRVNADALVEYLVSHDLQPPSSFDLANPADQAFVLQNGRVRVLTDGLPVGTRIWLNDPTSPVLVTQDPALTTYAIDDIAPTFEPGPNELPSAWTLTLLAPDGRLVTAEVPVPRRTMADAPLEVAEIDLRARLADPALQIRQIRLSPNSQDWNAPYFTLRGRVAQQLYVYAENRRGEIMPLVPNALSWQSLDPRVQVGGGTKLGASPAPSNLGSYPGLAGLDLGDHGLVYPLAITSATDAADLARVKGTLGDPAAGGVSAEIAFRIDGLDLPADNTSLVQVTAKADGMVILEGRQTLSDPGATVPLTVAEPQAGSETFYRWVADSPLITLGAGVGKTVPLGAVGDLGAGKEATVKVISSSGRVAEIKVSTAFSTGAVSGGVQAPTSSFKFDPLPTRNPGSTDLTVDKNAPLGGYIHHFQGQATIGAADAAFAGGGKFFWRSSDPFALSVSGAFPSQTATLTAYRPGTVTLTAIDELGRSHTTQVKSDFNKVAPVNGQVQAPISGIDLVGVTPAQIATDLNAVLAAKTYQAGEKNVASPAFRWISHDPYVLAIEPPAGESFPNDRATFKALRPGRVTFQLISAQTGLARTFTVDLAFASVAAQGTATVKPLMVRQIAPVPPVGSTASTVISRNPGEVVTLEVTDDQDPTGTFVWTTETPERVQVVAQNGRQAQVRLFTYGAGSVRVINTRNDRFGRLSFDVRSDGKGDGNIHVTL